MTAEQNQQSQPVDIENEMPEQQKNNQHNHSDGAAQAEVNAVSGVVEEQPASDVSDLQQRLQHAEQDSREYKDQWLRAVADYKNFKRRAELERAELIRSASVGLVVKLLPIIDDFDRAAASVPPEIEPHAWWAGTKLIAQKLRTILESEGVTPIEALGQDFDPTLHDAVMYEEAEGQDGKVIAEFQKGYRVHDRVLRPAMVKVGKGTTGS